MNTLRISRRLVQLALGATLIAGAAAFAADDPAAHSPVASKEMREQMASVHEKMATCLRSERPFADCRSEMQANCRSMMGKQGCPMMDVRMHERMNKNP